MNARATCENRPITLNERTILIFFECPKCKLIMEMVSHWEEEAERHILFFCNTCKEAHEAKITIRKRES